MSTILKTLKKLEEEKSVLEQSANLKGLVLQGEGASHSPKGPEGMENWVWIAGSVLGGALIVGGLFYYFPADPKPSGKAVSQVEREARLSSAAVDSPQNKRESFPGIPLESIPETESLEPSGEIERDLFDPVEAEEEAILPPPPDPVLHENTIEEAAADPVREIDELIKSATTSALVKEEPRSIQPVLSRTAVHFPEIRVKGIIFFDGGNLSNHVFVSTPKATNRKLKVGDTVENATLDRITSQTAIFKYQGHLVELSIGY